MVWKFSTLVLTFAAIAFRDKIYMSNLGNTHLFRIWTVLPLYRNESLWIGKVTYLYPFPVSQVLKLLIYQAQLCSTIILYINSKNNLRSDYTSAGIYSLIWMEVGLDSKTCESCYQKNVYCIFLLLKQEGMHAWIFIFLFSFPLCNAIVFFNTHSLPPPITSETSEWFLSTKILI